MKAEPSWVGLVPLLIKDTPESLFAPSSMWRHGEKTAAYESQSGLSPDTESAGAFSWGSAASRTVRNNLLFISHYIDDILLSVYMWSVMSNSYDPMNCSLSGFFVHGIFQARILEWAAISYFRGSSQPRDQNYVSWIAGRFLLLHHRGSHDTLLQQTKWTKTLCYLPKRHLPQTLRPMLSSSSHSVVLLCLITLFSFIAWSSSAFILFLDLICLHLYCRFYFLLEC